MLAKGSAKKSKAPAPKASSSSVALKATKVDTPAVSTTLDIALTRKAVAALFTYEAKQQESKPEALLEDFAKPILVSLQLIQPVSKPVLRPVRVEIPYSFFSPEAQGHSLCFFCRTEDFEKLENFFKQQPFSGLGKVVSVTQIRKHYSGSTPISIFSFYS